MADSSWEVLGIRPTNDALAIYDANRRQLGKLKLDSPAERYSQLMNARTDALKQVRGNQNWEGGRPEAAVASRSEQWSQPQEAHPVSPRVVLVGSEEQRSASEGSGRASEEYPPAFSTYPFLHKLDRFRPYAGAFGLLLLGIFIVMELGDHLPAGNNEAGAYYDQMEPLPDGPARDRAHAAAAQLFGPDVTWRRVEEANPWMAAGLVRRVALDEEDDFATSVTEARSSLRLAMLFSRLDLPRSDVVAVNRLYLGWLKTALEQGDGAPIDLLRGI